MSNKKLLAETSTLPEGWIARIEPNSNRVYYVRGDHTTFDHPTFGVIPRPWQLRIEGSGQNAYEYYYNTVTREKTTKNPRFGKKELESRLLSIPKELRESATVTKNTTGLLEMMRRPPLSNVNNRDKYEIVHTIDSGEGGIGGMNGGVFVVRVKGAGRSKLDVEKRFKQDSLTRNPNGTHNVGVVEILITRKLIHPALANAIDAFIAPDLVNPTSASLYLEFCDRGSLDDLINKYSQRIGTIEEARIPERFAWHAFVGLTDALSYLYGGRSFATDRNARSDGRPLKNWEPILHRDIKPDNILLRSRSTLNSIKYPYLVISDFGLATNDPDEYYQKKRYIVGTKSFFAPELLYNPFPKSSPPNNPELMYFPPGRMHTIESDLYALGLCIYNLCKPCNKTINNTAFIGAFSHYDLRGFGNNDFNIWTAGTGSRKTDLDVGQTYSNQLREMIRRATIWSPEKRGAAHTLAPLLVDAAKRAGFGERDPSPPEMLPEWSSRIHSYNAK